jgi:hypothetical protein
VAAHSNAECRFWVADGRFANFSWYLNLIAINNEQSALSNQRSAISAQQSAVSKQQSANSSQQAAVTNQR